MEVGAQNWAVADWHRFQVPANKFIFVAMDNASIHLDDVTESEFKASPELRAMRADFPWSRDVYAAAADRLIKAGARVIGIDVLFPVPRPGDDAMKALLARYPDHVVLASKFTLATQEEGRLVMPQLELPTDRILPAEEAKPPRVGYVNFWPEGVLNGSANNGLMEKATGVIQDFIYQIKQSDLGGTPPPDEPVYLSFAASMLKMATWAENFPSGQVRFREAPNLAKAVPIISLHHLFLPAMWKTNFKDGAIFRDKIVIIGPLADNFHDELLTPKGSIVGPLLHILAMGALLKNGFYEPLSAQTNLFILCGIGILLFAGALPIRRFWQFPILIGVLLVLHFTSVLFLFTRFNVLSAIVLPAQAILLTGFALFAYQYAVDAAEKLRTRRTLERYVSRNLVQEILDDRGSFVEDLQGTRKNVAILFSDIRGFTRFSENRDPHDVVRHLNEYLSAMVEIVFRFNGTLDKFIGDAVMAVWGNVHSEGEEKDILSAVHAAIEMLSALRRLNEKWHFGSGEQFRIGIGVNFGSVVFGNIGSEQKSDLTVIGDAVNLASRIESLTKFYNMPILIGGDAANIVRGKIPMRFVDRIAVVGRATEENLYAPLLDGNHASWLPDYEEGIRHFRDRDFLCAKQTFLKCPQDDDLIRLYVVTCEQFAIAPPPENEPLNLRPESGK